MRFHDEWIDTESMLQLRWCRSYTDQIITDTLHFCRAACSAAIDFHQQQMRVVQDAVDREQNGVSKSLVRMHANECRKFSLIQNDYFLQFH